MKLVVIESPYSGKIKRNIKYAKAAVRDSMARGEAPFASHLFFTRKGILRDTVHSERRRGIEAGLAWASAASLTAVYVDLGFSRGMAEGIARAVAEGRPIEHRRISGWDEQPGFQRPQVSGS